MFKQWTKKLVRTFTGRSQASSSSSEEEEDEELEPDRPPIDPDEETKSSREARSPPVIAPKRVPPLNFRKAAPAAAPRAPAATPRDRETPRETPRTDRSEKRPSRRHDDSAATPRDDAPIERRPPKPRMSSRDAEAALSAAQAKLDSGDVDGAARDFRDLRNKGVKKAASGLIQCRDFKAVGALGSAADVDGDVVKLFDEADETLRRDNFGASRDLFSKALSALEKSTQPRTQRLAVLLEARAQCEMRRALDLALGGVSNNPHGDAANVANCYFRCANDCSAAIEAAAPFAFKRALLRRASAWLALGEPAKAQVDCDASFEWKKAFDDSAFDPFAPTVRDHFDAQKLVQSCKDLQAALNSLRTAACSSRARAQLRNKRGSLEDDEPVEPQGGVAVVRVSGVAAAARKCIAAHALYCAKVPLGGIAAACLSFTDGNEALRHLDDALGGRGAGAGGGGSGAVPGAAPLHRAALFSLRARVALRLTRNLDLDDISQFKWHSAAKKPPPQLADLLNAAHRDSLAALSALGASSPNDDKLDADDSAHVGRLLARVSLLSAAFGARSFGAKFTDYELRLKTAEASCHELRKPSRALADERAEADFDVQRCEVAIRNLRAGAAAQRRRRDEEDKPPPPGDRENAPPPPPRRDPPRPASEAPRGRAPPPARHSPPPPLPPPPLPPPPPRVSSSC
ncbi:hypothetical protein M885DRAFT_505385, partial [Pelagophyceae sp. CCMP2097]